MPDLSVRDPLAGAASVTIVIHGVGDHSSVDIRAAAGAGLVVAGLDATSIVDVEVPEFPRFPEAHASVTAHFVSNGSQPAIEAEVEGRRHVLIPVVWSGMRPRAGRWAGSLGDLGGLQSLAVALPALVALWWDVLRCVPRSSGLWKIAVAGAAVLIGLVVAAFTAGTFWLFVRMSMFFFESSNLVFVGGFAAYAVLGMAIRMFSTLLDLPGDVARYVASDSARTGAVRHLRDIIGAVTERAPATTILLMSHSLGTVLASEALSGLPSPGRGRMILLTLGSPLKAMSRIFSSLVRTPTAIISQFEAQGAAPQWLNLWREEDWIGKALGATGPRFAESSLGPGLHANYWSDERLWIAVSRMVLQPSTDIRAFEAAWTLIPLTDKESAELSRRSQRSPVRPVTIALTALFLLLSIHTVYVPPWPDHHALWSRWAVRAASMLTTGLLAVSWYIDWSTRISNLSERQQLWELRSASARSWMLIGLSAGTASVVFALDWLARGR